MHHGKRLGRLQGSHGRRKGLLRNLVSELLHHEAIRTTFPKAKIAARQAEKIITMGKKDTPASRLSALAFLRPPHVLNAAAPKRNLNPATPKRHRQPPKTPNDDSSDVDPSADPDSFEPPPSLMPKLFGTLAERYANRPGGYTRVHKFGRRPGDNAPVAVVTLVDGPKDIKFEMLARTVGKEVASNRDMRPHGALEGTLDEWKDLVDERTKRDLDKVFKYRDEDDKERFASKARDFADVLAVEERVYGGLKKRNPLHKDRSEHELRTLEKPYVGRRVMAGERLSGMSVTHTGLELARGPLARLNRRRPVHRDLTPQFMAAAGDVKPASTSRAVGDTVQEETS